METTTTTTMMMSCVSFKSSIPRASNSSLFLSSPKLWNSERLVVSVKKGGRRRKEGLSCNALFGLGVPELVVIAGVAALVFGPKKLPEVGRSIGKTVKSFQQAAKEFESELKKEPKPDSDSIEGDSSEKPIGVSEQQEKTKKKHDNELSSSKESV